MNASNQMPRRRGAARRLAGAVWIGLAFAADAQMMTPLHVGAAAPIRNEFDVVLPGHAASPQCVVQLLWASNAVIYPPAANGQPHALNPPVSNGVTAIGALTAPGDANPGTFGLSIAEPRPLDGAKMFVRVFNANSLTSASFYADSQIFTVAGNAVFEAQVGATTNALDPADDDGDGLNNSWEESYGSSPTDKDSDDDGLEDAQEVAIGSSPTAADSDGDGVNDQHEWRAGTDFGNRESYLGLAGLSPSMPNLLLRWASVTGKLYQVEGAQGPLGGEAAFSNLTGVIPAGPAGTTETTITNALQGEERAVYRVRLVEE